MPRHRILAHPLFAGEQGVRYGQVSEGVPGLGQVYEGRGRSMLLSSCRGEAKLWDVGACRDRAEALWAPNEAAGDPLRTFEGVRTTILGYEAHDA